MNIPENAEIVDYIKEYLRFNKLTNTLECFDAEFKTKQVSNKMKVQNNQYKKEDLPRIYSFFGPNSSGKNKRELNLEKEIKLQNKKYT